MTQEEKQLLLNDLCARLPYGVKVKYYSMDYPYGSKPVILTPYLLWDRWENINGMQPYLRPMSSMTAEEEYEYHQCKNIDYLEICEMEHTKMLETIALCFSRATDWLNKNHFDYRGLIPMGLALEAPEGMYKVE